MDGQLHSDHYGFLLTVATAWHCACQLLTIFYHCPPFTSIPLYCIWLLSLWAWPGGIEPSALCFALHKCSSKPQYVDTFTPAEYAVAKSLQFFTPEIACIHDLHQRCNWGNCLYSWPAPEMQGNLLVFMTCTRDARPRASHIPAPEMLYCYASKFINLKTTQITAQMCALLWDW